MLACRPNASSAAGPADLPQFHSHIEPGQRVRHPQQPDWGVGQVQSAIEDRITVNFPNAGKVVINARAVSLEIVEATRTD